MITLQQINESNFLQVCALRLSPEQRGFFASPAGILAHAYACRGQLAVAYAICNDGAVVGVVMVHDMDAEPACYHLAQLMIDQSQQCRGYAHRALQLLLAQLQAEEKYPQVELCVKRKDTAAISLYQSLGFHDTGYTDPSTPDSLILALPLDGKFLFPDHVPSAAWLRFSYGASLLEFSAEDQQTLMTALHGKEQFFLKHAADAYAGTVPDFPICQLSPLKRLVTLCIKLSELAQKFRSRGIPHSIFSATAADIRLRQRLYLEKTGKLGLSKSDGIWFRHLFGFSMFQLGSLQFQMLPMVYLDAEGCGEDYMRYKPEQKRALPPGTPVLDVHIPHGTDLSPGAVEDALKCAPDFFARYFPEYQPKALLCVSWILYPPMQALLPPDSNLTQFAKRWEILATAADSSEAISRIYGKTCRKIADYPQTTTLQRNALHCFSQLGVGDGIIILN